LSRGSCVAFIIIEPILHRGRHDATYTVRTKN
jgi:hypothetical protein